MLSLLPTSILKLIKVDDPSFGNVKESHDSYAERTILLKYRSENKYVGPLKNLTWTFKLVVRMSKLFIAVSSCLNVLNNNFDSIT